MQTTQKMRKNIVSYAIEHKKKTLGVIVCVCILAVVLVLNTTQNPLEKEQRQFQSMKSLGKDEKTTQSTVSDVKTYVTQEKQLKDVTEALQEFQGDVNEKYVASIQLMGNENSVVQNAMTTWSELIQSTYATSEVDESLKTFNN